MSTTLTPQNLRSATYCVEIKDGLIPGRNAAETYVKAILRHNLEWVLVAGNDLETVVAFVKDAVKEAAANYPNCPAMTVALGEVFPTAPDPRNRLPFVSVQDADNDKVSGVWFHAIRGRVVSGHLTLELPQQNEKKGPKRHFVQGDLPPYTPAP